MCSNKLYGFTVIYFKTIDVKKSINYNKSVNMFSLGHSVYFKMQLPEDIRLSAPLLLPD